MAVAGGAEGDFGVEEEAATGFGIGLAGEGVQSGEPGGGLIKWGAISGHGETGVESAETEGALGLNTNGCVFVGGEFLEEGGVIGAEEGFGAEVAGLVVVGGDGGGFFAGGEGADGFELEHWVIALSKVVQPFSGEGFVRGWGEAKGVAFEACGGVWGGDAFDEDVGVGDASAGLATQGVPGGEHGFEETEVEAGVSE